MEIGIGLGRSNSHPTPDEWNHTDLHIRAARPITVVAMALANCDGAGDHLGAGRAGGDAGGDDFGWLTDRLGRKKLFTLMLLVYLLATAATAFSWSFHSYSLFRFMTGLGIGGGYAAINSAIDELIPARLRGWIDLVINSTYWLGAALGAAVTVILLKGHFVPQHLAWRFVFGVGALLGLGILILRHWVPESPRWLVIHGRNDEAEKIVCDVEEIVAKETKERPPYPDEDAVEIDPRTHTSLKETWAVMTGRIGRGRFLGSR
jgi:MFS family permease